MSTPQPPRKPPEADPRHTEATPPQEEAHRPPQTIREYLDPEHTGWVRLVDDPTSAAIKSVRHPEHSCGSGCSVHKPANGGPLQVVHRPVTAYATHRCDEKCRPGEHTGRSHPPRNYESSGPEMVSPPVPRQEPRRSQGLLAWSRTPPETGPSRA